MTLKTQKFQKKKKKSDFFAEKFRGEYFDLFSKFSAKILRFW